MSREIDLDVRRDVCVSLSCDNTDRVRLHALSKVDPSKVERKIVGLTALLQVQHGKSYDWSNYAHITSACLLLAAAADLELRRRPALASRLLKWASVGLHVAMPQVRLWASAWLVVTVVGAHESNLVYMPQGGAGVLEALNCGHRSATYRSFAKVAGVAHTASHELRQQGHAWLRSASAPLLQQACAHIGGTGNRGFPPERCSVDALLKRLPRLYERKRCASNLSATRGIYFNTPRVVRLSGEDLDLMWTLRGLLMTKNTQSY